MTNFYRVFYMNQFRKAFTTRDAAQDYILDLVFKGGGRYAYDDFEILDRSDYL